MQAGHAFFHLQQYTLLLQEDSHINENKFTKNHIPNPYRHFAIAWFK